jgi:hypothetical protein
LPTPISPYCQYQLSGEPVDRSWNDTVRDAGPDVGVPLKFATAGIYVKIYPFFTVTLLPPAFVAVRVTE